MCTSVCPVSLHSTTDSKTSQETQQFRQETYHFQNSVCQLGREGRLETNIRSKVWSDVVSFKWHPQTFERCFAHVDSLGQNGKFKEGKFVGSLDHLSVPLPPLESHLLQTLTALNYLPLVSSWGLPSVSHTTLSCLTKPLAVFFFF